mmetsp:Transcript_12192/g.18305  ORF Transcript_12192/g.18305 Transcript_12192/m.18305 type:complete len:315 (-) Transcript_12192:150-1094(-)
MKTSITSTASILLALASYSHHGVVLAQFTNLTFNLSQPMNLSSNMTIDWTIHNDQHTRYCGPKTVGGYEIAKKYCSPQTACGISGPTQGTYGGNGNDCKGRDFIDLEGEYSNSWMCFTDIRCVSPSNQPSDMPSGMPSSSAMPSSGGGRPSVVPSATPSKSSVPSVNGRTQSPTRSPSISPTSTSPTNTQTVTPTGSPVEVSLIKVRGYFCGSTYDNAVEECDASKSCNSNVDCSNGEECYPNVSCEFMASEAKELGDHEEVVVVVVVVGADDSAVPQFSNDGGGSSSSLGFVSGGRSALVSVGCLSAALLWLM